MIVIAFTILFIFFIIDDNEREEVILRILVVLHGSSESEKRTFIKQNHFTPYTLCLDDIRSQYGAYELNLSGTLAMTNHYDTDVFHTMSKLLKFRLERGIFTIVNIPNITTKDLDTYQHYAKQYHCHFCVIHFNQTQTIFAYQNKDTTFLTPKNAIHYLNSLYQPSDFSTYSKIHHFGDIHGCFTVLQKYLHEQGGLKSDELYLFVGDYIDRGIENEDMLLWMIQHMHDPNIIFVEGNHEKWLWLYANHLEAQIPNNDFHERTIPQIENINRKDLLSLCQTFHQMIHYTYGTDTFIVTHAGISTYIKNELYKIPTEQFIKGIGRYEDMIQCCQSFEKHCQSNEYQIFGHRNLEDVPIHVTPHCFNLNDAIEKGGYLRVLVLSKAGFKEYKIKNSIFSMSK